MNPQTAAKLYIDRWLHGKEPSDEYKPCCALFTKRGMRVHQHGFLHCCFLTDTPVHIMRKAVQEQLAVEAATRMVTA